MNKKCYIRAVKRRLNLPRELRQQVLADFENNMESRLNAGMTWDALLRELGSPQKAAAELNEKMKEYVYRKSPWRFLFGATAVLSGGWLVFFAILQRFLLLCNILPVIFSPTNAASVGIIGGADGPTSVFIAGAVTAGPNWDLILIGMIFAVSVFACFRLYRCKPKK